jgi:hypothetical protein
MSWYEDWPGKAYFGQAPIFELACGDKRGMGSAEVINVA